MINSFKMTAEEFMKSYGAINGRSLANRIGLYGKGSIHLAYAIHGYAANLATHREFLNAKVPQRDMSSGSYDDIAQNIAKDFPKVKEYIS